MTWFLLSLVVAGNVAGDLLKTAAMRRGGEIHQFHLGALARVGRFVLTNGLFWLSIAGYAIAFFAVMGLFSVADVSFAVPATASSYIVETLLARVLLNERISPRRWMALGLVTLGVVLVAH